MLYQTECKFSGSVGTSFWKCERCKLIESSLTFISIFFLYFRNILCTQEKKKALTELRELVKKCLTENLPSAPENLSRTFVNFDIASDDVTEIFANENRITEEHLKCLKVLNPIFSYI